MTYTLQYLLKNTRTTNYIPGMISHEFAIICQFEHKTLALQCINSRDLNHSCRLTYVEREKNALSPDLRNQKQLNIAPRYQLSLRSLSISPPRQVATTYPPFM